MKFDKHFTFGTATSSYQIEGAHQEGEEHLLSGICFVIFQEKYMKVTMET